MDHLVYEGSAGQIRRAAARYLRRAHAAGARSVQADDVLSELNVAWCVARDKFDPALGVPFAAYLARGMQQHINQWIDEQIGHVGVNLDAKIEGEFQSASIHEVIADDAPTPDVVFEERATLEFVLGKASPNTARFIELMLNPPAFLFQEVDAARERSIFARERGIPALSPKGITADLVFNLMGIERHGRNVIYGEMKKLAIFMNTEVTK